MRSFAFAAALLLPLSAASAAEFGYHALFDRFARLNSFFDPESAVDDWMQCFRNPVWQRAHNNEFEMETARKESLSLMKKEIDATDLSQPMTIVTKATLGDYDFSNQRFHFRPIEDSTYFQAESGSVGNCFPKGFPQTLRLTITNPEVIGELPMPPDKARAFIGSRQNGGSTDRTIELTLSIRAEKLSGDDSVGGIVVGYKVIDTGPQKLGVIFSAP